MTKGTVRKRYEHLRHHDAFIATALLLHHCCCYRCYLFVLVTLLLLLLMLLPAPIAPAPPPPPPPPATPPTAAGRADITRKDLEVKVLLSILAVPKKSHDSNYTTVEPLSRGAKAARRRSTRRCRGDTRRSRDIESLRGEGGVEMKRTAIKQSMRGSWD